ncbi:MAG: methionyl-tRNA formyltransferase [Candidatus Omnitrophota bacterium]
MDIVFFGTDKFALPCLQTLMESRYKVLAVVTGGDTRKGRHLPLVPSLIKEAALKKEIPVFQPQDINSPDSLKYLESLNPDLFIVVHFGQILKREVLAIPKIFSINIHASLLPKYRGASCINWAIINGDKETGITIIKMNEFMDKGEIILKDKIGILASDDYLSLKDKLSKLAASSFAKVLHKIENRDFSLTEQNEEEASYAPKLKKQDGLIDWQKSSLEIHNRIRGLLPWPGSFTYYKDELLKIYKSEVQNPTEVPKKLPGYISEVNKEGISVITGGGILTIKVLQLESSKVLDAGSFIAGHKISPGDTLG